MHLFPSLRRCIRAGCLLAFALLPLGQPRSQAAEPDPAPGPAPAPAPATSTPSLPPSLRTVLDHTKPLAVPRGDRLPLLVLPISHALAGVPDDQARAALRELDRRGIAYSVSWNAGDRTNSVREALRIATLQRELGMWVVADATGCVGPFFDGTDATLHEDENGKPFAETSFGGRLGCPFTLEPRIPAVAAGVDAFLMEYDKAGLAPGFVFADWEVDGPIEWNDAWSSSRKCRRCRANLRHIEDFRQFQHQLRGIRSRLQREAFASRVTSRFPSARVANYGVNPHDGFRYWYDYFEKEIPADIPHRADQKARYREWSHEFAGSGYNAALPVIYTWYPIFAWYDFPEADYRWFYNMLLEGSSSGKSCPPGLPLIPFVHWTTTAPPGHPDPATRQFSSRNYQELLSHLLLRGHDTFFLWCMPDELAREVELVHPVYAEALRYRDFMDHGTPVSFDVPGQPSPVVSGLRLGDRVLARRTDFGAGAGPMHLQLTGGGDLKIAPKPGYQVLEVSPHRSRPE